LVFFNSALSGFRTFWRGFFADKNGYEGKEKESQAVFFVIFHFFLKPSNILELKEFLGRGGLTTCEVFGNIGGPKR